MTDNDLTLLRHKLKQGDYDGADIMATWIAIDELLQLRAEVVRLRGKPIFSACAECGLTVTETDRVLMMSGDKLTLFHSRCYAKR